MSKGAETLAIRAGCASNPLLPAAPGKGSGLSFGSAPTARIAPPPWFAHDHEPALAEPSRRENAP